MQNFKNFVKKNLPLWKNFVCDSLKFLIFSPGKNVLKFQKYNSSYLRKFLDKYTPVVVEGGVEGSLQGRCKFENNESRLRKMNSKLSLLHVQH